MYFGSSYVVARRRAKRPTKQPPVIEETLVPVHSAGVASGGPHRHLRLVQVSTALDTPNVRATPSAQDERPRNDI